MGTPRAEGRQECRRACRGAKAHTVTLRDVLAVSEDTDYTDYTK